MKRKIIRITESDVQHMIMESVKRVLKEYFVFPPYEGDDDCAEMTNDDYLNLKKAKKGSTGKAKRAAEHDIAVDRKEQEKERQNKK